MHIFPLLLAEDVVLGPLDEVDPEVLAVCRAGSDLWGDRVVSEAIRAAVVLRQARHREELRPLEFVLEQRLQLERPYFIIAASEHKTELGFDLEEHFAY